MKPVEKPVTVGDGRDGTVSTHPAFGLIGAHRVSGKAVLFGSDFVHHGYVNITIRRAEMNRSLSRDWPFGRQELIEVSLSEAQWATFVSSMNISDGVPCTIEHVQREVMPAMPVPARRDDVFAAEMDKALHEAREWAAKMREKVGAMGLSAKKASELLDCLHMLDMRIGSSVEFVAKQFGEHMEDVTEHAKLEVNAYALRALHGLELPIEIGRPPQDAIEG